MIHCARKLRPAGVQSEALPVRASLTGAQESWPHFMQIPCCLTGDRAGPSTGPTRARVVRGGESERGGSGPAAWFGLGGFWEAFGLPLADWGGLRFAGRSMAYEAFCSVCPAGSAGSDSRPDWTGLSGLSGPQSVETPVEPPRFEDRLDDRPLVPPGGSSRCA
jgi:hypothetical protein